MCVLLCVALCPFWFCGCIGGEGSAGCFAWLVFLVFVMVVWLFLAVPWVCLQFVIVVFPDHSHLLFLVGEKYIFKLKMTLVLRKSTVPMDKHMAGAVFHKHNFLVVFLMLCGCYCYLHLPQSDVVCYAVCDCGISCSYSIMF